MDATNVNLAKCIVDKTHIGYDDMINFCTGQVTRIDWVPLDWVLFSFLAVFFLAIFAAVALCFIEFVFG